jgi:Protein of unknown function (DUF4230)
MIGDDTPRVNAGPPDTGPPDTGPPDTGPPDTGPTTGSGAPTTRRWLPWAAATAVVVLAIVAAVQAVGLIPQLANPFHARTTDRSQPALLKSVQDLSRYVAADGNFQVVVDLQNDRKYVPDFLYNDRTLFVAAGTVEVYVDFGRLGQGAISVSDNRQRATVSLPAPALGSPNLDNSRSYVVTQQRGLVNRVGDLFTNDPNKLQDVYRMADDKITSAARDSGLAQRAKDNTQRMLEGMLRSLGYSTVVVDFATP